MGAGKKRGWEIRGYGLLINLIIRVKSNNELLCYIKRT